MTDLSAAIKRAHAVETHPSAGNRAMWDDQRLSYYPDSPVIADIPPANAVVRVTYGDWSAERDEWVANGDYCMYVPIDDRTMPMARDISTHDGVMAVALYEVDETGQNVPSPSIAYVAGKELSL